jgi:hypothetical protein
MSHRGGAITRQARGLTARRAANVLSTLKDPRGYRSGPSDLLSGIELNEGETAVPRSYAPEEQEAALGLIELSNAVEGDIDLAIAELAGDEGAGGKRKMKGGSKTGEALRALKEQLLEATGDLATKLDNLGELVVSNLPAAAAAAGGGGALIKLLQNPWLFSDLALMIRDNWVYLVPQGPSYNTYLETIADVLNTTRTFGVDQYKYVKESPVYAFVVAAALVKVLANRNKQTTMQYLQEKLNYTLSVIRMASNTGKEIINMFIAKIKDPETKKAIALQSLRSDIQKLKSPGGKVYEGLGPAEIEGLMKQIPDPAQRARIGAERLADALNKIRARRSAAAAAAAAAAVGGPSPAAPAAMGGPGAADAQMEGQGRRRRKTKKRAMKKRRMTRRRLTFSY